MDKTKNNVSETINLTKELDQKTWMSHFLMHVQAEWLKDQPNLRVEVFGDSVEGVGFLSETYMVCNRIPLPVCPFIEQIQCQFDRIAEERAHEIVKNRCGELYEKLEKIERVIDQSFPNLDKEW